MQDEAQGAFAVEPGKAIEAVAPALPEKLRQRRRRLVELAAAFVDDAFAGFVDDGFKRPWLQRLSHNLSTLRTLNVWCLMLLAFVERPTWCFLSDCGDPSVVLRSGTPTFPPSVTVCVELACLALLTGELALRAAYLGRKSFWKIDWHRFKVILLTVSILDTIVAAVAVFRHGSLPPDGGAAHSFNATAPGWVGTQVAGGPVDRTETFAPMRIAPLLRPLLFIAANVRVRELIRTLLVTVPRIAELLLLLFLLIFFYGTLGVFVFRDFGSSLPEAKRYFNNFESAYENMLVLLTTANYPDVMMPAYTQSRWYSLFFISFLAIALFFLLNVLLASIVDAYQREMARVAKLFRSSRREALHVAFGLLRKAEMLEEAAPAATDTVPATGPPAAAAAAAGSPSVAEPSAAAAPSTAPGLAATRHRRHSARGGKLTPGHAHRGGTRLRSLVDHCAAEVEGEEEWTEAGAPSHAAAAGAAGQAMSRGARRRSSLKQRVMAAVNGAAGRGRGRHRAHTLGGSGHEGRGLQDPLLAEPPSSFPPSSADEMVAGEEGGGQSADGGEGGAARDLESGAAAGGGQQHLSAVALAALAMGGAVERHRRAAARTKETGEVGEAAIPGYVNLLASKEEQERGKVERRDKLARALTAAARDAERQREQRRRAQGHAGGSQGSGGSPHRPTTLEGASPGGGGGGARVVGSLRRAAARILPRQEGRGGGGHGDAALSRSRARSSDSPLVRPTGLRDAHKPHHARPHGHHLRHHRHHRRHHRHAAAGAAGASPDHGTAGWSSRDRQLASQLLWRERFAGGALDLAPEAPHKPQLDKAPEVGVARAQSGARRVEAAAPVAVEATAGDSEEDQRAARARRVRQKQEVEEEVEEEVATAAANAMTTPTAVPVTPHVSRAGDGGAGKKRRGVDVALCLELFVELNSYHRIPSVAEEDAHYLLSVMTMGQTDRTRIKRRAFGRLLDVLQLQIVRQLPARPEPMVMKESSFAQRAVQRLLTPAWESMMSSIVLVNVILILTVLEQVGARDPRVGWQLVELCFTTVYTLESAAKLLLFGRRYFFSEVQYPFDAVHSLVSMALEIYILAPTALNAPYALRYILLIRMLRVFRLLAVARRFRVLFASIQHMSGVIRRMLSVLWVALYIFAQVGIVIFGGRVYVGNPALKDTQFEASKYWANNFNDFGSSLVTLFELLVVNNWFIIMDGVSATVGSVWKLYFVTFYVVGVLIVLNLVVAVILDAFEKDSERRARLDRAEEKRRRAEAARQLEMASQTYAEDGEGEGEGSGSEDEGEDDDKGEGHSYDPSSSLVLPDDAVDDDDDEEEEEEEEEDYDEDEDEEEGEDGAPAGYASDDERTPTVDAGAGGAAVGREGSALPPRGSGTSLRRDGSGSLRRTDSRSSASGLQRQKSPSKAAARRASTVSRDKRAEASAESGAAAGAARDSSDSSSRRIMTLGEQAKGGALPGRMLLPASAADRERTGREWVEATITPTQQNLLFDLFAGDGSSESSGGEADTEQR